MKKPENTLKKNGTIRIPNTLNGLKKQIKTNDYKINKNA
jgi:hypothetical protein